MIEEGDAITTLGRRGKGGGGLGVENSFIGYFLLLLLETVGSLSMSYFNKLPVIIRRVLIFTLLSHRTYNA